MSKQFELLSKALDELITDYKNGNIEERYITVEESIKGSCKEIKEMHSGKKPKPSWNDFKEEIATGGYITKDIKETIDLEHRDYFW